MQCVEVDVEDLPLASIGCAYQGGKTLFELLRGKPECSTVAGKISDSLIRVASTRIFADPFQALMEIPVNSLDSYNKMEGKPPVGKFGMGFFAMFYWLVGNPGNYLRVSSCFEGCSWTATVRESGGRLRVSVAGTATRTARGTTVELHVASGEVGEHMDDWMRRLDHTALEMSKVGKIEDLEAALKMPVAPGSKPFWYFSDGARVVLADRAEGISTETLFGTLLIPSISTKGIAAASGVKGAASRSFGVITGKLGSVLQICVNRVVVEEVEDLFMGTRLYTVFLPQGVALPVSRDMVLYEEGDGTYQMLAEQLFHLVKEAERPEELLRMLHSYAATDVKRTLVGEVMRRLYQEPTILWVPERIGWDEVKIPGYRIVETKTGPVFASEKVVYEHFAGVGVDDMFEGKRVVYVKDLFCATNLGYSSLLLTNTMDVNRIRNSYLMERLTLASGASKPAAMTLEKITADASRVLQGGEILREDREVGIATYVAAIKHILEHRIHDEELRREFACKVYSAIGVFKYPNAAYGSKPYMRLKSFSQRPAALFDARGLHFEVRLMMNSGTHRPSVHDEEGVRVVLESDSILESIPGAGMWLGNYFSIWPDPDRAERLFEKECGRAGRGYADLLAVVSIMSVLFFSESPAPKGMMRAMMRYLQSKYTLSEVEGYLRSPYLGAAALMRPLANFARLYKGETAIPLKVPNFAQPAALEFTCSQLMDYLYTHDVDANSLGWIEGAAAHRCASDCGSASQALGIAVNEGTTKPYVQAVLTELAQNSLDAIRSTNGRNDVEIVSSRKGFSFSDYIGIPDAGLLSLMVPFLSTKKAGDVGSTGEMGSGFFNVYRQPHCRRVAIRTDNGAREVLLGVRPLLQGGRVVDLAYSATVGPSRGIRGSTVWVGYAGESVENQIDVELYSNQLLAPLSSASFVLNGEPIQAQTRLLYRNEAGSVYYSSAREFESLITTAGVPVAPLAPAATGPMFNYKYSDDLLSELSSGLVIDVNKGYYTPVQSRDKLVLGDNSAAVRTLFRMGFYNCMHLRYVEENQSRFFPYDLERYVDFRQVIPHTGHYGNDPSEVMMSAYLIGPASSVPVILSKLAHDSAIRTMKDVKLALQRMVDVYKLNFAFDPATTPLAYAIDSIIHWLRNKSIAEDPGSDDSAPESKGFEPAPQLYQDFVRLFWKFGLDAEESGKLKGTSFSRRQSPPDVLFGEISRSDYGYYEPSKHAIVINSTHVSSDLTQLWEKVKPALASNPALDLVRDTKALWDVLALELHQATTIVHELTHAWAATTHSSHGPIQLTILGETETHNFEYAANAVYAFFLQQGFLAQLAMC